MSTEMQTRSLKQSAVNATAITVLLVGIIVLGAGIARVQSALRNERTATARQAEFKQLGLDLARASDYLTDEARRFAVTSDRKHLKNYWDEIDVTKSRDRVITRLKELNAPEAELALIERAKQMSDALVATETRSMRLVLEATGTPEAEMPPAIAAWKLSETDARLAPAQKLAVARKIMFDARYDQDKSLIMGPIAEFQRTMNARATAEARAAARVTHAGAAALKLVAGILALCMGATLWIFHSQMGVVITRYTRALDARSDRDLDFALHPAGTRELRCLAIAFNDQLARAQALVRTLDQSARTLAASSADLSGVSLRMGSAADETAAQAGVVAAAAEQVSRNVEMVAAGAEEMGASIREIAHSAQEAARVAGAAVEVAASTSSQMARLGDSSAEIGHVVKVITGIAEQTNLLALNATIEAARAGEAGKGFAVVANEVKELAKCTSQATEEIGQKVAVIQADTQGAVTAIEQISAIIGQINEIQTTIAGAVEEQSATTSEISRNVGEASRGVQEIAANVGSVARSARETAQDAGQSQRAASELAQMAAELQQMVDRLTAGRPSGTFGPTPRTGASPREEASTDAYFAGRFQEPQRAREATLTGR